MNTWLFDNFGTIVVTLLLVLIVTFIVRNMILDRKQGKNICGGNCSSCKMCSSCRQGKTATVSGGKNE